MKTIRRNSSGIRLPASQTSGAAGRPTANRTSVPGPDSCPRSRARSAADEPEAEVALVGVSRSKRCTISTSLPPTDCKPCFATSRPHRRAKIERRVFHSLQIEAVLSCRELADPKALPSSIVALGRAPPMLVPGSSCSSICAATLPPLFDRLRCRDQLGQLMRPVVPALGCGRLRFQPEAQIACAVLWSMQQVIDFLEVGRRCVELVLDHAPPPGVGAGVAHRAGNPLSLSELIDLFGERQLEGSTRPRRALGSDRRSESARPTCRRAVSAP